VPVLLTEKQFDPWLSGEAGVEYLKLVLNDFLQKWPKSKRFNSSRSDDEDPTLIERVQLAAAEGVGRPHNHSAKLVFRVICLMPWGRASA
jgi:hypothetical protein